MATKHGEYLKTHEFPFKLQIYLQEVALDNMSDVEVGRVMIGESVTHSWNINNFGNQKIIYRVRLENIDGEDIDIQAIQDGIKCDILKTPSPATPNSKISKKSTPIELKKSSSRGKTDDKKEAVWKLVSPTAESKFYANISWAN